MLNIVKICEINYSEYEFIVVLSSTETWLLNLDIWITTSLSTVDPLYTTYLPDGLFQSLRSRNSAAINHMLAELRFEG